MRTANYQARFFFFFFGTWNKKQHNLQNLLTDWVFHPFFACCRHSQSNLYADLIPKAQYSLYCKNNSFVCRYIHCKKKKKKKKPLGKACAEHTQNMQDGKRPNVIKAYMKADIPICRALAAFL